MVLRCMHGLCHDAGVQEIRLMKAVLLGGTEQRTPPDPFSSSSQAPKHITAAEPPHLPHPIPTVFVSCVI